MCGLEQNTKEEFREDRGNANHNFIYTYDGIGGPHTFGVQRRFQVVRVDRHDEIGMR